MCRKICFWEASVPVKFGAKGLKVIQIPTSDGIISIKLVI